MADTWREERLFGNPGHCYNIDGEWWHEPGTCKENDGWHSSPCCGVVTPAEKEPAPEVVHSTGPTENEHDGGANADGRLAGTAGPLAGEQRG